jgi:hypothetical protein
MQRPTLAALVLLPCLAGCEANAMPFSLRASPARVEVSALLCASTNPKLAAAHR